MLESRGFHRLLYVVDSGYVVKGVKRCLAKLPHASNADLWKLVAAELVDRDLVCLKIESHLSIAEVIAQGVAPGAFLANRVVDIAAGKAAESSQLPFGEVEGLQWSESIAASVRFRCAATFLASVEADVRAPPVACENPRADRRVLAGRIDVSEHGIVTRGKNLHCLKCRGHRAIHGSRAWLASACNPG